MNNQSTNNQAALRSGKTLFEKVGDLWTFAVLILIIVIFTIIDSKLMSAAYWLSTLVYMVEILLLAVGETYVIITGGIDLSVGAIEGFVSIITALVIKALVPSIGTGAAIIIGVMVGLLVGLLIGLINGLIITRMKITPFVATLGMMGILTGLTFISSGGNNVVGLPWIISRIGNYVIGGIFGFSVMISWIVSAIAFILLRKTRFGVYTYAIGSNQEAAKRAGVNVNAHLLKVYMTAGGLSALSGVLILMRFATASPLTGSNVNLNAIAAVVIGGTSLFGGRGNLIGTFVGSAIISVLITGLVMINVEPFWQMVAIGFIIIIAVYIDQIREQNS